MHELVAPLLHEGHSSALLKGWLEGEAGRAEGPTRVVVLRSGALGVALPREEALRLAEGELVRALRLDDRAWSG